MTDVGFRLAEREDAGRLNRALAQLSGDLGDTHRADDIRIIAAGWGPHPVFRAMLAERDDRIVGVALYSPCFSTARGVPVTYVSDLWVAEPARGSGLGQSLLSEVVRDAAETWGATHMKLNVYHAEPRARSFYERLRFSPATHHAEMHLDAEGCARLGEAE